MKKIGFLVLMLTFILGNAQAVVLDLDTNTVKILNKKTKEKLVIRTKRMLCSEDDVLVCDFALLDIEDSDGQVTPLIEQEDKISIYTVIESINDGLCNKAHHCKYEYPYQKTVTMIKDFKGAAVIQTPFYLVSDSVRLPFVLGKILVQSLKFKMIKGRKIIKNLYPLNENRKNITVKFNHKNYVRLLRALRVNLYTMPDLMESIEHRDFEIDSFDIQRLIKPKAILSNDGEIKGEVLENDL